jgi:hypothetical protein
MFGASPGDLALALSRCSEAMQMFRRRDVYEYAAIVRCLMVAAGKLRAIGIDLQRGYRALGFECSAFKQIGDGDTTILLPARWANIPVRVKRALVLGQMMFMTSDVAENTGDVLTSILGDGWHAASQSFQLQRWYFTGGGDTITGDRCACAW